MKHTFSKAERLCSKTLIDRLFSRGKSVKQYPLTIIYHIDQDQELPAWPQLLISVPKKRFKRANKRNRIKRLIRETYRLNKHQFFNGEEKLLLGIVFQGNELPDFDFLQKKLILGLQRFTEINKTSTQDPVPKD